MMLPIPTRGMPRSIEVHNIDLDVLCDWVEGSVLFQDGDVSASDIIDVLIEGQVYDSQEFAWQIVNDAWGELRRRQNCLGDGFPIGIHERHLRHLSDWRDTPAHSFCLMLAFAQWYPIWARRFGMNFTEQGELFELLTKESLQRLFSGWVIHPTGWRRTRAKRLTEVVADVATHLGEPTGSIETWTKPRANDAGLDLLCYRPFPDGRVGVPVYLLQCASGGDWESKLHTPDLRIWGKIVNFTSSPKKAFATPLAWLSGKFRQNCNIVNGMLLDRYRLLLPAREDPNWVSGELRARLVNWLEPRIAQLPRLNE